jgi:hypothetical protein
VPGLLKQTSTPASARVFISDCAPFITRFPSAQSVQREPTA